MLLLLMPVGVCEAPSSAVANTVESVAIRVSPAAQAPVEWFDNAAFAGVLAVVHVIRGLL